MDEAPKRRVSARLVVLREADGGRHGPIFSGYRGRFMPADNPAGLQEDYFAETTVPEDSISPGHAGEVEILIGLNGVVPEVWPGLRFALREGARVVATGEVLRELPEQG